MEPREKSQKHSGLTKYHLPARISISVLIWLVIMSVFCSVMDIQPTVFYPLQENMVTDVMYADGTTAHYEDGDFGILHKGDKATIRIDFPREYRIKAAELFVPLHNVILNVSLEGRGELYRDNVNMTDTEKHYGNRIYEVSLPGDFERKTLVLELTAMNRLPFADLSNIGIIPANEGWKQIISGHTMVFLASIALMVMAMICICYFAVKSIEEKKIHMGLFLAVFEMVICGWYFGSLSMFYLIVEDVSFCAKIEYYSLYLAPVPLSLFIYQVIDRELVKKLVLAATVVYSSFYVISTVVERLPGMPNYSKMLPAMHILAGVTVVCLMLAIFGGTKSSYNSYIVILRFGIFVAMICGLWEIARFNIVKYVFDDSWITTKGLSGVAILVVAVSLVVYLIAFSTSEFAVRIEQRQLLKLAYQDALTGMSNRADGYRNIEVMEKKQIRDYTMVFIDLNNLKLANDSYGHDMGDKLLKVTADAIMEVFSEGGFTSRWGGDEFVACVFGENEKALEGIRLFESKLKEWDASGEFPFEVSAACGWVYSSKENYLAPIEAIRLADEDMYEKKRKMKALRSSFFEKKMI